MKILYCLVGVPGSGKSTWVQSQDCTREYAYISTDKYIDEYAALEGKTYNDVFNFYIPVATTKMEQDVVSASNKGVDIIWDQTSINKKSRKRKIRMLPDYYKIAIVFNTPDDDELNRRLQSRPGKSIPGNVLQSMKQNYETPTLEEGFDEVWYA